MNNRSFAVDDIVVGDANVKPALLSVDPAVTWNSEVGAADREIAVSATKPDTTADSYTVVSSDPKVVAVASQWQEGRSPCRGCRCSHADLHQRIQSGSAQDHQRQHRAGPSSCRWQPNGKLNKKTQPEAGNRQAYADGELALSFDAQPVLTGKGSLRIFRAADGKMVDMIKPVAESDAIGPAADGFYRGVAMPLMRVAGSTLLVRPHNGKLEFGTKYYVAIAEGTLKGAKLGGKEFTGSGQGGRLVLHDPQGSVQKRWGR